MVIILLYIFICTIKKTNSKIKNIKLLMLKIKNIKKFLRKHYSGKQSVKKLLKILNYIILSK